jgi:predicted RNase H-like HicB family nuclease
MEIFFGFCIQCSTNRFVLNRQSNVMKRRRSMKKVEVSLFLIGLLFFGLVSCSPEEPSFREEDSVREVEKIVEGETVVETVEVQVEEEAEEGAVSSGQETGENEGGFDGLYKAARSDRMIIKDAQIRLQVEDTGVAIDRTTQIVEDVRGYIISSRVWYQDYRDNSYQYSTITIGVPVDQFERTLRRLRDIALNVLDENATGEDVTDQYVDLESELENLEAPRDRIRGFLEQAETVEEALKVNQELSEIEGQIAEIKGRMNYLEDRAAYSTITINLEPKLPEIPTATPSPTLTPTPTPTPAVWKPGETLSEATGTLTNAYQGFVEALIWLIVVAIPVLAPFALILWLLWYFLLRTTGKEKEKKADIAGEDPA